MDSVKLYRAMRCLVVNWVIYFGGRIFENFIFVFDLV